MFSWHLPSQSRIKEIISSGKFTLEDLLQESYDIVVSAANDPEVYNYLKDTTQLIQLIDYVMKEPVKRDDVSQDQIPELQKQLLLSTTACDAIAQSAHLLEEIIKEKTVLDLIFDGLKNFKSQLVFHRLTTLLMAFFSIGALEVMDYIKTKQSDFLQNLVFQIGRAPTEDILSIVRLLLRSNSKVPGILEWLASERLIKLLISNLGPGKTDITCRETVVILQEVIIDVIAKSQLSDDHDFDDFDNFNLSSSEEEVKAPKTPGSGLILLKQFEDQDTLDLLFNCLFSSSVSQIYALPFLMNVISQGALPSLVKKSLLYIDHFLSALKPPVNPQNNSHELGFARLAIMKFLIMLLKLDNPPEISAILVEKGSFPVALDLLFTCRNNTVIHNLVLEYFTVGLTKINFVPDIISGIRLTARIVDAWDQLTAENAERLRDQALSDHALSWLKKLFRNFKSDPDFPVQCAVRLQILKGSRDWSYFGHLFKMAHLVNSVTPQIGDINYSGINTDTWKELMENEKWKNFVGQDLKVYYSIAQQKLDPDYSDSELSSEEINDE